MKTSLEKQIEAEEQQLFNDRKSLRAREKSVIQKKVDLREDTMINQYSLFIEKQAKSTQESVYLNKVILRSAIISYYYDIHRFKEFSGSEWANKYKQAAYTVKWIVRFRPIQIKESTEYVSAEIFDVNIKFALVCGFAFLGKTVTDLIMKNKKRMDLKATDKKGCSFYDELLYDLRYRQLSGKKLILAFEAIESVAYG
jgi:hypothetical protein